MKKNLSRISIALFLLFLACGETKEGSVEEALESNDLETLRTKRKEIEQKTQELNAEIKQLDQAITQLDTIKNLPLVNTFVVNDTVFNHFVEIQGNVTTDQNVLVYPEYQGVLNKLYVNDGAEVKKGQILARIDDGGLSNQLTQMETQAALAKTTFERQKRLWDQNIGSEIQYLQAKANYESQESAVAQMRNQVGKTIVRAPFSGKIDEVLTDEGTVVNPGGQPLFRIVNLSDMFIEAQVPERYVDAIQKGSMANVFFPVLNREIKAEVRETGSFISPSNRTFRVEVAVDNKDSNIKPNMTARVRINDYSNTNALLIPLSVISENSDGEQYVYLAKKDTLEGELSPLADAVAMRSIIETGLTQGDFVEVLKGIKSGEAIINEGARSVKQGQEVEIINN
ncbi:MAG: efflux RND transporter periplasmic adaptor subunit [Leeuwenhoekiella sp.]